MSVLTNDTVADLFSVEKVGDAGVPKYAEGFDNNNVPGFGVDERDADAVFGREIENASSTSDISINPTLRGGGRRRNRKTKRRYGRKTQKGGKPRFQLTLKATIRMRKQKRSRSKQQH
jgi:hypothetical protein